MVYTTHGHHIRGTVLNNDKPPPMKRCGGPGLCRTCSTEALVVVTETYDEDTIYRVNQALLESGLNGYQAIDAIIAMENAGILFREKA